MGYGRQVSFRENPNRWNFKSDRDFRTLAATVYQSEVRICTPTDWYLKKRVLNSRVRWIVGMHVGSRDRADAEALWKSFPPVYRQCAVCYADFWSAYEQVLPKNRHRAVGKESGKMNRIERFNLTLRQRISRLVRKTLSFSKKIEAHIGTIWNFIRNYNAEISPKLAITTY